MAPSSQVVEPPTNPVRFRLYELSEAVKVLNLDGDKIVWRLLKCGWFNTDHYHVAVVDLSM